MGGVSLPAQTHPAATQALLAKLGPEVVRTDEASCFAASFDNMRLSFMPEAVIRPATEDDIGATLKELFGDDVEDVETAKTVAATLREQAAANAKVDPAKIKADIERSFNTERENYKGQLGKMETTLSKHLVDNAAVTALSHAAVLEAIAESYAAGYAARDAEVAELRAHIARLLAVLAAARAA